MPYLPIDILVAIIHESDWKTLLTWRGTSKAFFAVVAAFLRSQYEGLLRSFIDNIPLFDDLLSQHGAIISGSAALHFFLPDNAWEPEDLDIYVPATSYRQFVRAVTDPFGLKFRPVPKPVARRGLQPLTAREGGVEHDAHSYTDGPNEYERIPCDHEVDVHEHDFSTSDSDNDDDGDYLDSDDDGDHLDSDDDNSDSTETSASITTEPRRRFNAVAHGMRGIQAFHGKGGRRIAIICSPSNNPVTPLRFFPSSLTMNFITPHGCVCGFPTTTLSRLGILRHKSMPSRDRAVVERYRERRFDFQNEEMRELIDMWDYLFFGERRILITDFRPTVTSKKATFPIVSTPRGWVPNSTWLS